MDIDSNEGASEHVAIRKSGSGVDAIIARLLGRELCNSNAHPNETEGVVSPAADSSQRWVLHACDDLVQELQHWILTNSGVISQCLNSPRPI